MESIIKMQNPLQHKSFKGFCKKNFFDERFYTIEVIILKKLGKLRNQTTLRSLG